MDAPWFAKAALVTYLGELDDMGVVGVLLDRVDERAPMIFYVLVPPFFLVCVGVHSIGSEMNPYAHASHRLVGPQANYESGLTMVTSRHMPLC